MLEQETQYENKTLPTRKGLAIKIEKHWKEHYPRLYKGFKTPEARQEAALRRAEATYEYAETLEKQLGYSSVQAALEAEWEVAYKGPDSQ